MAVQVMLAEAGVWTEKSTGWEASSPAGSERGSHWAGVLTSKRQGLPMVMSRTNCQNCCCSAFR